MILNRTPVPEPSAEAILNYVEPTVEEAWRRLWRAEAESFESYRDLRDAVQERRGLEAGVAAPGIGARELETALHRFQLKRNELGFAEAEAAYACHRAGGAHWAAWTEREQAIAECAHNGGVLWEWIPAEDGGVELVMTHYQGRDDHPYGTATPVRVIYSSLLTMRPGNR